VPLLDALRAFPGILLEVIVRQSSELAGLVAQGSLDMAIAIDALPQRGIAIQPLFREELYVALPRAASRRRTSGISLEELAKLPLVLPSAPNATRTRLELAFLNANLNYRLVAEISAPDLLIRLVEAGDACSVLPWSAIHREVAEDRLQAVPLLPDTIAREVSLCESEDVPPGEAALVVRRVAKVNAPLVLAVAGPDDMPLHAPVKRDTLLPLYAITAPVAPEDLRIRLDLVRLLKRV